MNITPGHRNLLRQALMAAFAVSTAYALFNLFQGSTPTLAWVGLLLASGAPLAGLLTHQGAGRPPLVWTATSGLGMAITLATSHRYGPAAGVVHVWAGCSLILWFLWVKWLSPNT